MRSYEESFVFVNNVVVFSLIKFPSVCLFVAIAIHVTGSIGDNAVNRLGGEVVLLEIFVDCLKLL